MRLWLRRMLAGALLSASMSYGAVNLPFLPLTLPKPNASGITYIDVAGGGKRSLTIIPELQEGLNSFIRGHGNPIASVVVVDAHTGEVLAMAQGESPSLWGSTSHTALYEGFPAASLFKMAASAAAVEVGSLDPDQMLGLTDGCANVHPRGGWLKDIVSLDARHKMSLSRAFANSCNGFFARLTVKYLGLGAVNKYAEKLGWGRAISSDFHLSISPINSPSPATSSIHTVGRYAAGFGMVGMSAMHAAWVNLVIARDGHSIPLRVFADSDSLLGANRLASSERLLSPESTAKLRYMMHRTVLSGTASSAFRGRAYRKFKPFAGGKTGTLTGQAPKGLTTWFAGLMPYQNPEVVVSAVVVNGPRWVIKGSQLAAEAFRLWDGYQEKKRAATAVSHKAAKLKQLKS